MYHLNEVDHLNEIRKKLAIITAIFLLIIIGFFSFVNMVVVDIHDLTEEAEEHKQRSVEDFLELSIGIQHNFIDIINEDWETFVDKNSDNFNKFIDNYLASVPSSAIDSVILASDGEEVFYKEAEFVEYDNIPYELDELKLSEECEIEIVGGDPEADFGSKNRFYYTSTQLDDGKWIIVGFLEEVMYSQFISSLDLSITRRIQEAADWILGLGIGLMFIVILKGLISMYYIGSLREIIKNEITIFGGCEDDNT